MISGNFFRTFCSSSADACLHRTRCRRELLRHLSVKWRCPTWFRNHPKLLKNFMINTFRVSRDVLRSQQRQRSTSTSESNFSFDAHDGSYRVVRCKIAEHRLVCRTWRAVRKLGRRIWGDFRAAENDWQVLGVSERRGRPSGWFICVTASFFCYKIFLVAKSKQTIFFKKNIDVIIVRPIAGNKTPAISNLE